MDASIIIPAYNAGKTITACLNSMLKQKTSLSYEIIVADDGSKDRTKEIIAQYHKVMLLQLSHKGPAVARNSAAKKAKGKILLFIDADCIADANWLNEMLKPFKDNKVAGVQGRYKTKQKSLIAKYVQLEIENRYEKMKAADSIDFIGTYSAAYRSALFRKFKGFDESFPAASGEDPEFSYRLSKSSHKMVFAEKAIVFHQHPETLFAYLKTKFYRAYWRVRLYSKHKSKMIKDTYTPLSLKLQIPLTTGLILFSVISNFNPEFLKLAQLFLLLFIASALPFTFFIFQKNFTLGLLTIPLIFLRSSVFILGLCYAYLRGVNK